MPSFDQSRDIEMRDYKAVPDMEMFPEDDGLITISVEVYVSAIVPQTDDPSTPSLSFRVLVLGTLWNIFLAAANSVFMFRTTQLYIPSAVATLLAYPMGILMARVISRRRYHLFGRRWTMNPGPFSIKEHVLISIIASSGGGLAYGVDNVVIQKFKHFMDNPEINYFNSLAFVMSVQLIGFGLAGILRRFLVKPAAMYWPNILSQVALFVGFHEKESDADDDKYRLSRFKFFWICTAGFFVYTWLPEYFITVLQTVSVLCFVTNNRMVRFLASAGYNEGVGIGAITFDWYYIGGGVLTTPFWASLQFAVSNILWGWILVPILYSANAFGKDQMLNKGFTLNTPALFSREGIAIRAVSLMADKTYDLNQTAYDRVQPIYITTFFALQYGTSFMAISAAVAHVFLWYGKSIVQQFRAAIKQVNDEPDIHNRLMRAYPDVPDWVFLVFLCFMVVVQICVSLWTPFAMPIWSIFLCLALTILFLLPIGVISAITGLTLGLNVLTEFVIGLMIPGQTIAVMAFKSLGTNTIIQAMSLIGDLKLGHYMKINPIHMIIAQLYGTVIGAVINNSVSLWCETLLSAIIFISDDWKAQGYEVFYSAGAIWGAIGPQRFFGIGSVYESLLWFFLIGFTLPILPWIGNKIYPSDYWHYINIPLLATGAPQVGSLQNVVLAPIFFAWLFQYYIFHRHYDWWKKYNYTLAVASDTGVALAILVITILNQLSITAPVWPGNPVVSADYYCFDNMGWS